MYILKQEISKFFLFDQQQRNHHPPVKTFLSKQIHCLFANEFSWDRTIVSTFVSDQTQHRSARPPFLCVTLYPAIHTEFKCKWTSRYLIFFVRQTDIIERYDKGEGFFCKNLKTKQGLGREKHGAIVLFLDTMTSCYFYWYFVNPCFSGQMSQCTRHRHQITWQYCRQSVATEAGIFRLKCW